MDEDGPPSLVDMCLMCVCQSFNTLCSVCDDGSLRLRSCPVFPPEVSDLLLRTMTAEGLLNDGTVGIFLDVGCLRLKRACFGACRLAAASFCRILRSHHLQELDASGVLGDITVSDVLQSLSENPVCRRGLQRLNVSRVSRLGNLPVTFRTLEGLRSVSVAWTPVDNSMLEDMCSLPLLDSLDISGTKITDLTPLVRLRSTLRRLCVHTLHRLHMADEDFLSVLSEMELLTHLDVSDERMQTRGEMIEKLLLDTRILPALIALDVSGWKRISDDALTTFVEGRPGMRFIGLLATGAGRSDLLSGEGSLKVAGDRNIAQLCEALRRYRERESFLQEALLCLYKQLNESVISCRPDVLNLVYLGMKAHSKCVSVQVSGSACVFNLSSLAEGMSQSLLGNVMKHVITIMRDFPDHKQIQRNCLMTMCINHILDVVHFDRCEAAKQVMMCFISNEDQILQSLCSSVIIVLMSQLRQEEITQLGSDEVIMKQLLHVVQQKASVGVWDEIFEVTLMVLWGLTDDTHSACTHFLQCEGLELYKELLETYYSNPRLLKLILGLLNNLSEMEDLRSQLMDQELLQLLLILIEGKEVQVSYLAGGFLANVTSGSMWSLDTTLRHEILHKLHSAVMSWTPPDSSIVSYRSLRPLCSLIRVSQPPAVQLWALWGIKHICTHKESHYRRMLEEEGGVDELRTLTSDPKTHSDVHTLALHTLHLVEGRSSTHTSP